MKQIELLKCLVCSSARVRTQFNCFIKLNKCHTFNSFLCIISNDKLIVDDVVVAPINTHFLNSVTGANCFLHYSSFNDLLREIRVFCVCHFESRTSSVRYQDTNFTEFSSNFSLLFFFEFSHTLLSLSFCTALCNDPNGHLYNHSIILLFFSVSRGEHTDEKVGSRNKFNFVRVFPNGAHFNYFAIFHTVNDNDGDGDGGSDETERTTKEKQTKLVQ